MRRHMRYMLTAVLALSGVLPVTPVLAHDPGAMPAGGGNVKADMLMWIKDAEDKLIQLAEATPDANYSFRPSKEVRTTGEVFMHVSAANYGVPSFWGVKPPEGFNFATHEKSLTKKADIVQSLKDSFAYMEKGFMDLPDTDMDKPAEFFGMKTTVRSGYMLLLSHAHEHLGQSIAYARSNGIVPPWSAKEAAPAKKAVAEKNESK